MGRSPGMVNSNQISLHDVSCSGLWVGRLPLHSYRRTAGPEFDKASKRFFIAESEKGVKLSGDSSLMCAALAHTFAAAGMVGSTYLLRNNATAVVYRLVNADSTVEVPGLF